MLGDTDGRNDGLIDGLADESGVGISVSRNVGILVRDGLLFVGLNVAAALVGEDVGDSY